MIRNALMVELIWSNYWYKILTHSKLLVVWLYDIRIKILIGNDGFENFKELLVVSKNYIVRVNGLQFNHTNILIFFSV